MEEEEDEEEEEGAGEGKEDAFDHCSVGRCSENKTFDGVLPPLSNWQLNGDTTAVLYTVRTTVHLHKYEYFRDFLLPMDKKIEINVCLKF